ncbi:MAG: ribonuclease HII [Bacteroidales bacterium]|nr:ribonuclease HII [Bacteroidales bacterium]MBQ3914313.1 ribonuclease HII [Paludibacteraceae bacterium]MBR4460119.1 ribonuclease HII [Paludibacteraceae bacterium]MBR6145700.1 ribonuclease HII [Paludibacteraceae bacterium]
MLRSWMISGLLEAGCDEAGRGPLAGSVFAAAVILPEDFRDERLNDSKQLTEKQRLALRPVIEQEALAWAVAEVTAEEIDRINILNASILGMQRALDKLSLRPAHILVDGNKWKPYVPEGEVMAIPADTVVHGDATYMSIAAASILAKTYRDEYMLRLHEEFPCYGWADNKGYPTEAHYAALRKFGPCKYHRQSFNLKIEA